LQNKLIQTSQTAGQQYSDTSPLVVPGERYQKGLNINFSHPTCQCRNHYHANLCQCKHGLSLFYEIIHISRIFKTTRRFFLNRHFKSSQNNLQAKKTPKYLHQS
jgi:hypothetical protein